MADWFETRFRQPVDAGQPDPAFVARIRALVVEEWQADAGTIPPDDHETHTHAREGDIIMLETEDRPIDHEPGTPRRPRGRWLLAAAAVAAVAIVGALLVAATDDDKDPVDTVDSNPTIAPPQDWWEFDGETFEPGRYFTDLDGDPATPLRVTWTVTAEGWEAWPGAYKFGEDALTNFSIIPVSNLPVDGCTDHRERVPAVGPTVDDLATALTAFPPFEVVEPPTDVTLFGYRGKHVKLIAPDLRTARNGFPDCEEGELHSWIAGEEGGPYYGYGDITLTTEEYWILDVEGTRVVLVKLDSPNSPAQDIRERDAMFDSIRIEP